MRVMLKRLDLVIGTLAIAAVRETGALETGARETGALETGARETGALETGARETGARETGARETGARETGALAQAEGGIMRLNANVKLEVIVVVVF